jgi:multicomponent Na+:H+ antiporter subunit C
VSVTVAFAAAVLFATGTWLLLQRRLSRIIIGIGLLGHGANLLLVTSGGGRGGPPIIGSGDPSGFADPLPQALALTAIVITFGVTVFLLAMGYRSWQLTGDDEVEDDVEDRLVARAERADREVADERALQASQHDDEDGER